MIWCILAAIAGAGGGPPGIEPGVVRTTIPELGQVAKQRGVVVDTVRRHEGAVLDGVHTGRDAGAQRLCAVGMSSHRKAGGIGRCHEHPQRLLVELRLPRQRPRGDVAAGHHHLDDVDAALGPSAHRGRQVCGRRRRPGQEVAVPPGSW